MREKTKVGGGDRDDRESAGRPKQNIQLQVGQTREIRVAARDKRLGELSGEEEKGKRKTEK